MRYFVKKACSIALCFILALFIFLLIIFIPSNKFIVETLGNEIIAFDSGSGTKADPYLIGTKEQLTQLSYQVNNGNEAYNCAYYELACDIVLNDGTFNSIGDFHPTNGTDEVVIWDAIGNNTNYFMGVLNGNGFRVSGIFTLGTAPAALFGFVNKATIYNLGVINGYLGGYDGNSFPIYSGGIVANCQASKIINCHNSSYVFGKYAGGIAGYVQKSTIINCYNTGLVSTTKSRGGIVGGTSSGNVICNNYYLQNPQDIIAIGLADSNTDDSLCASFENYESMINIAINNENWERSLCETLNYGAEHYAEVYELTLLQWAANNEYPNFGTDIDTTHLVTYNATHNGGGESVELFVAKGEGVDLQVNAEKEDYIFVGWHTDCNSEEGLETLVMGDEDITLYAIFSVTIQISLVEESTSTIIEGISFNNETFYSFSLPDINHIEGWQAVGWRDDVDAKEMEYMVGETIELSQSKTFYAIYERQITLSFNDIESDTVYENLTSTIYYNASKVMSESFFTLPKGTIKAGYTFDKWLSEDDISFDEETFGKWEKSTTFIAKYTADSNIQYKVLHNLENVESSDYNLKFNEILLGTTDTDTLAIAKDYEGFTAQEIIQTNINGDGSTVIDIYYIRNLYNISFRLLDCDTEPYLIKTYKYNQKIDRNDIDMPERLGYKFLEWVDLPVGACIDNANVVAKWEPIKTRYKVLHFLQTLQETYDVPETVDELNGNTDSMTVALPQERKGYFALDYEQQKINADGSTEIHIKYQRNGYNLRYMQEENNEFIVYTDVKYFDSPVPVPDAPEKKGVTFVEWSQTLQFMPSNDVDIFAKWELNVPKIVGSPHNIDKVYDGQKEELVFEVSHDLDQIIYKWYRDDSKESVYEGQVLGIIDVSDSGNYYCEAKVNYNNQEKIAKSKVVTVKIDKAKIDTKSISFDDKKVYYDGLVHTIEISGELNSLVKVTYTNNSGVEIGEYIANANFTVNNNYDEIPILTATLFILEVEIVIPSDKSEEDDIISPPQNIENGATISEEDFSKENLQLNVANCMINIDKQTLCNLKTKAKLNPVVISVSVVDINEYKLKNNFPTNSKIYNLSLLIDNQEVEFSDVIELSLPYILKENEDPSNVKVWALQNESITQVENVSYENGFVKFSTNSFSNFAVGCEESNINDIANETVLIVGGVSIISIVVIVAIVIISIAKKRKSRE